MTWYRIAMLTKIANYVQIKNKNADTCSLKKKRRKLKTKQNKLKQRSTLPPTPAPGLF